MDIQSLTTIVWVDEANLIDYSSIIDELILKSHKHLELEGRAEIFPSLVITSNIQHRCMAV